MSGFIGMFGLIKKFQKSNENAQSYQMIQRDSHKRDSLMNEESTIQIPPLEMRILAK